MIFPEVPFTTSADHSLGVEWELALVDRTTKNLVNLGGEIVNTIHKQRPSLVKHVHKEFLCNTVELVTGITHNAGEAIEQLRQIYAEVTKFSEPFNVDLFGAGTHPLGNYNSALLTNDPRYEEMVERTQWWGRQMLIWGIHVHVGITRKDRVMPILSTLLSYYPHLLALSASSPLWEANITGYASNRAMLFQQLPTAGLPFQFTDWGQFEEFVYDQRKSGIIDNLNEIRWDVRPAPSLGTLEIRISDSLSSFDDIAAIVAFSHCLVVWLDQKIAAGEQVDILKPWQVQENKWRAARYGLDAIITTHSDNSYAHIIEHTRYMIEQLTPIAHQLGCWEQLQLVHKILDGGASYQRQLRRLVQYEQENPFDIKDASGYKDRASYDRFTSVIDGIIAELG